MLGFALVLLPFAGQSAAADGWAGDYVYEEAHGKTAGGSGMVLQYAVHIGDGCEIVVSGFQTHEQIICTLTPDTGSVTLRFKSYRSGDVKNRYGVQVYAPGQPLLEFERTVSRLVEMQAKDYLARKHLT